jgi:hypothetical protein
VTSWGKHLQDPISSTYHPSYTGSINRRIEVQASPGMRDPISKMIKAKRAEGMAQVIECPTSKCKVLSPNPCTTTLPHPQVRPKPQHFFIFHRVTYQ